MVNTKIIRQPSQPPPSLLSSPLPLSPPPSFLSLLSLSSSHYPKISNSHSITLFPFSNPSSSTASLSIRTRHPPHFFSTLPTPIPNSSFSPCFSLCISLFSLLCLLGLLFSAEGFNCFRCGGFGRYSNWIRFAKDFWLRRSTSLAFYFSYFMF